jgi:hypothetical protein
MLEKAEMTLRIGSIYPNTPKIPILFEFRLCPLSVFSWTNVAPTERIFMIFVT